MYFFLGSICSKTQYRPGGLLKERIERRDGSFALCRMVLESCMKERLGYGESE